MGIEIAGGLRAVIMASIPIANIYYLLCYAWNEFAPRQIEQYTAEEFRDTLHLFSSQLVIGIRALHRRGVETGYIPIEEPTSSPRGRILMVPSIRTMTRQPMSLFCASDEMSSDIQNNQIMKATLKRLLGVDSLNTSLRREVRQTASLFCEVRDIELNARVFHTVHVHQNNRLYSFLLTICRFLFECMDAVDQVGKYRFREVDRDEKRMRRIFEKFVLNFFASKTTFDVKSERMDWRATANVGSSLSLLPEMRTDATLRSDDRTIIIECKYTEKIFRRRFDTEKLRSSAKFQSSHLYQLCTYLHNLEQEHNVNPKAEGILLYPATGDSFTQSYHLHGHRIRVQTLDLNQPWAGIESQLLSLIEPNG